MFGRIIDNETIHKVVLIFGTVFNNVKFNRHDVNGNVESSVLVPIDYSSKSQYLRRLFELSTISDGPKVQIQLPRMGYELTGFDRDSSRALNQLTTTSGNDATAYKRTAYNFDFNLYILANTSKEMWAILEQILPYFDPDVTATYRDNATLGTSIEMTLNIGKATIADNFEGPLKESTSREILCTIPFSATAVFYGPSSTRQRIETVLIDYNIADIDDGTVLSASPESHSSISATVPYDQFDVTNPAHIQIVIHNDVT